MNVKKYDVRVRESRIPYLVAVGKTKISDEDMHQSPKRIADVIRTVYHADRLPEEHMFLLTFDVKLHLIGLFEISHGTHQESVANPSQIIQRVLLCGVDMCDHIIIAGARKNVYFSFRENTGILQ